MFRKTQYITFLAQILLIITVIFPFLPIIFKGEVIYWGTSSTQFIPWLNFAFSSLSQGDFPLWNMYNGMGAPFLANYQTALFYFPNWIIWIFFKLGGINGLAYGTTLSILFHLLFGSFGMFKLLKYLKRSPMSAYFGSVIWVFGGYAISRVSFFSMIWSFSWVSWIIFALVLLFHSLPGEKFKRITFLSFLLSMQLLSGHAQTTYFTLIISAIILLIHFDKDLFGFFRKFGWFLISFIFSVLLSAIQLLPTAEYLLHSQRSQEVGFEYAVNFSYWPLRILSIFFGNFWGDPGMTRFFGGGVYWEDNLYIGIFPTILIFLLVIYFLRKRKLSKIEIKERKLIFSLLFFGFVAFLFSLGKNFFLFPFFYKYIPTFNMFQAPSRFLLITNFCLAITSAYAFDHWTNYSFNPRKMGILIIVGLGLIFSDLISMEILSEIPREIHISILFSGGLILLFGVISILKENNTFQKNLSLIIAFALISSINIILVNFPYGNFFGNQFFSKISESNRVFTNKTIFIDSDTEEFIKFNRYFRFDRFQLLENLKSNKTFLIPNTNLVDPQYKMINNFDPFQPKEYANFITWLNSINNDQQNAILQLVGTSIFAKLDVNSDSGYELQPLDAREIVQWYDCAVMLPADDTLDWILYNETIDQEKRCIVLENGEYIIDTVPGKFTNLENLSFNQINSGEISITYSAKKEGWLVIRQTWYPGWQGKLDGAENIDVEKVDYMFQGLFVPAGTHDIVLKYVPLTFTIGFYISLVNWIILILLCMKYCDFHIIHLKKNKSSFVETEGELNGKVSERSNNIL